VGSTAILIALAYGGVTLVAAVLAFLVAFSTRGGRPIDARKYAERERGWLLIVVVILAALLAATIWFVPYGAGGGGRSGDVVVYVTARQFGWQIDPPQVPVSRKIEFRLVSRDVNHGFGIYDDRGRFVAQVQVVPDKTQRLVHTFARRGRYTVLCLEFCGYAHHLMQGQFEVTE
jgi:cytochrome c oxidase subunit 2